MPHIGLSDTTTRLPDRHRLGGRHDRDRHRPEDATTASSRSRRPRCGRSDGAPLKTILEYAEERGLSTGVITNDALTGATPAATYAKANDRGLTAAIFQQIFTPRFGDGVDVMIGGGRPAITRR